LIWWQQKHSISTWHFFTRWNGAISNIKSKNCRLIEKKWEYERDWKQSDEKKIFHPQWIWFWNWTVHAWKNMRVRILQKVVPIKNLKLVCENNSVFIHSFTCCQVEFGFEKISYWKPFFSLFIFKISTLF
jgi:hypothetical protein